MHACSPIVNLYTYAHVESSFESKGLNSRRPPFLSQLTTDFTADNKLHGLGHNRTRIFSEDCVAASVMGYWVDRVSPRVLATVGATLAGVAVSACAFAPSLVFITVFFGVFAGKMRFFDSSPGEQKLCGKDLPLGARSPSKWGLLSASLHVLLVSVARKTRPKRSSNCGHHQTESQFRNFLQIFPCWAGLNFHTGASF